MGFLFEFLHTLFSPRNMNRQNAQKHRLSEANKTMKKIQFKNNTHQDILFKTALSLSLTIQIFALNAYSSFKDSANQSNIQTLSEFLDNA